VAMEALVEMEVMAATVAMELPVVLLAEEAV
jgi:hypothetical protein